MDFEKKVCLILRRFSSANYCKNPNKFSNQNHFFFYFGKKSHPSNLLLLTKVLILKEAHLVGFCDFVIFNYCKWRNLSTNYKNGILYMKMFCQNKKNTVQVGVPKITMRYCTYCF